MSIKAATAAWKCACIQGFLPGSRDGKFPGKLGVLKFFVFREIYFGIPENFLYISKDFSATDIHHSDIKKWVRANFQFFCLLKFFFKNCKIF